MIENHVEQKQYRFQEVVRILKKACRKIQHTQFDPDFYRPRSGNIQLHF